MESADTSNASNRNSILLGLVGTCVFAILLFISAKMLGVERTAQAYLYNQVQLSPSSIATLSVFLVFLSFSIIFVTKKHGVLASLVTVFLFFSLVAAQYFEVMAGVLAAPILFFLFPFYYLGLKGRELMESAREVGLAVWRGLAKTLAYGVGAYILSIVIAIGLGLLFYFANINDGQKVAQKITALPLAGLVVAVVFSPLAEEVFFRGFLQQRLGIMITSAVFALGHLTYGSLSEIALAFALSIFFGVAYKLHKNLWAITLTHMLFNLTSIIFMHFIS